MKAIKLISSVILVLSMFCLGCSDDSNFTPTGEPDSNISETIRGTSYLKVTNTCPECAEIFFDGSSIGEVEEGCCRTWNVPEGKHIIKIYGENDMKMTKAVQFEDGKVTTLIIDVNLDGDSDLAK